MKELALYVLDLAQNSVVAGAKHITIDITADVKADHLLIRIVDDGKGMSPHLVERVTDPFFTSRKERRFGLGIPFFKDLVEQCGGTLTIKSKEGEGTIIEGKL
ncbi:MAG TPA: ATP-binding protein, partial [Coprothermobacter proteolyticus]|nr:ATP-binding protein [Coprothermobacter proteolyticus]